MSKPAAGIRRRCTSTCPARCRVHSWGFTVELPADAAGQRRQVSRAGFATAGDAARARAAFLLAAADGGADLRAGRRTVADALAVWLEQRATGSEPLKPTTLASYRSAVERVWTPALGHLRLAQVTPAAVQAALDALAREGMGAATRARHYAVLRAFLRDAYRLGALLSDPTARVRPPRPAAPEHVRLTVAELRAMVAAFDGHRFGLAFRTALDLGLRRGELLGARWSDVDLDAGTWRVASTRVTVGHRVEVGGAKTVAGTRTVPMPPGLVERLRGARREQAAARLRLGPAWTDTGLVFTGPDGSGLHPHAVTVAFGVLARSLGLDGVRLHDLRHASAALGATSGESLVEVSKRLGHASTGITGSLYSYAFASAAAGHAAAREALLDGTG